MAPAQATETWLRLLALLAQNANPIMPPSYGRTSKHRCSWQSGSGWQNVGSAEDSKPG
jgi:hypothetical protein